MAEFLADPSVLTKEKLKSALLANKVALPNGDQKKGVYVELYLKNLTSQNKKSASVETFSSDEELVAPTVSSRSSSGRKATRKSDRIHPFEVDVAELTNEGLKDQLLKYGVTVGPIVASTRKLYEKKLQRLLDQGAPETSVLVTEIIKTDSSRNGSADSEQFSDKEEERTAAVPEPEPEPELEPDLVPVVERPLRSRGKTPVSTRQRSSQHKIEKLSAAELSTKTPDRDVLKEMFPNDTFDTPTGISATPRQPIKGAAGRPFSDAWLDNLRPCLGEFKHASSSYVENRSVPRVSSVPLSPTKFTAAPSSPSVQVKTRHRLPVWVQLLLLSAVAGFLFFVYQAMESNEINPFVQPDSSRALDTTGK